MAHPANRVANLLRFRSQRVPLATLKCGASIARNLCPALFDQPLLDDFDQAGLIFDRQLLDDIECLLKRSGYGCFLPYKPRQYRTVSSIRSIIASEMRPAGVSGNRLGSSERS